MTLWNLNYDGSNNITIRDRTSQELVFTKEPVEFTKEFIKEPVEFTKEFIKASRQIYKLISMNPKVSTVQMADSMGLSTRQVLKYLKRLQDLGKIARVGGRKMGEWKIIDEEYEGFFDRIVSVSTMTYCVVQINCSSNPQLSSNTRLRVDL